MRNFLNSVKARAALAGLGRVPGGGKPEAAFQADKAASIASYADFCDGGASPPYPLEIFLEVSNICDLKCAMCVQFSALNPHRLDTIKRKARGFMNEGEVSENLENALRHALLVHCFGYGEPTIHPTFRSFLDLISRYEVLIDFFTNGMHLDDDFCAFLVDRKVHQITVSFSGATKEIYEGIYIGGDFEKVLGGIKRLSELKKAKGTRYPIIEINSLGFRDHVAQFDRFVELMADHGADVVFLKQLQHYKIIPQLYEHVSIMRPEHEGAIVARAMEIGRRRGIQVNAKLYTDEAAVDEQDYERRKAWLKDAADQHLGADDRAFGQNPIADFGAIAEALPAARDPDTVRKAERTLSLDVPTDVARGLLQVRKPPSAPGAKTFHCMEPFKTLYVSRNGAAKPCCFANPGGWHLGDVKRDEAVEVWRGEGFQVVRDAIAEGKYPMRTCEACLVNKSGPQGHSTSQLLRNYLAWHQSNFSGLLRHAIDAAAPRALRLIAAEPSDIMARMRQRAEAAGDAAPAQAAWSVDPAAHRSGDFVGDGNRYLHRDFGGAAGARDRSSARPATASALPALLFACTKDHYNGNGAIIDLSGDPDSGQALAAGLRANPRFDEIATSFQARRERPVRRFGRVAIKKDSPGDDLIEAGVGDGSDIRWLASKPIEICVVAGGAQSRLFHIGLRQLLPFFTAGETILIVVDFYRAGSPHTKVMMGFLAGHFEWLGQAGNDALYRLAKPVPAEWLGIDPDRDLAPDLCIQFHRYCENANLPRPVQLRINISLAHLLAGKKGAQAAIAHLDGLSDSYPDLTKDQVGGQAGAYAKLITRARGQIAARARSAAPDHDVRRLLDGADVADGRHVLAG